MGDFIKRLKGVKRELIILSIALILLGILLILFPETSVNLLCRGIGIALCVWGVLRLMSYFKSAGKTGGTASVKHFECAKKDPALQTMLQSFGSGDLSDLQ